MSQQRRDPSLPLPPPSALLGIHHTHQQRDYTPGPLLLRPIPGWVPIGMSSQAHATLGPKFSSSPVPPSRLLEDVSASSATHTQSHTSPSAAKDLRLARDQWSPMKSAAPDLTRPDGRNLPRTPASDRTCSQPGCGAIFDDWKMLQRHAFHLRHTSFACQLCPEMFVVMWDRTLHWSLHNYMTYPDEGICHECHESVHSPTALAQHGKEKGHHAYRCFNGPCLHQDLQYAHLRSLRRHQAKHHCDLFPVD